MLSIIIPVHREPYLNKTIDSLLENCITDIEIIVVFDGISEVVSVNNDSRIKIITIERAGLRKAINVGLAIATGEYIMKCDAHCAFAKGFDKELVNNFKENWLIIPRRYSLNEMTWTRDENRPIRDYHYLAFPYSTEQQYGKSLLIIDWLSARKSENSLELDDTMSFQGSCWLANRKYFMTHIGYLDDRPETYGTFIQESLEIGMKYWLGGGAIKVNKKTWYAHLSKRGFHYSKGMFSRKFKKDKQALRSYSWVAKHWMNNEEPNMIKSFSWLIKKFVPIPTWDNDWQEKWNNLK